jgi:hypothetical protein
MKDEQTRQELDDARRELQQKMDSMTHEAKNFASVHLKQKAIQKQRVKNLPDNASKRRSSNCIVQ